MRTHELGRSGIQVPPLCIGTNVFGWTVDESAAYRILDAAVELGLTFLDTADVYSRFAGTPAGESEAIIGRWLKRSGKRDKVIIATKVGEEMEAGKSGLSPRYIEQAVAGSLMRLQTDYIDLYQAHRDDAATPLADTLSAFGRLMDSGLIRAVGASNYSADRLKEALSISLREGIPRFESLQPEYNLYTRRPFETELAEICQANGLGVLPFWALAGGFLTGKYRSLEDLGKSKRGSRVEKYITPRGMRILDALDAVAIRTAHATPGRIALAWLMSKPGIVPISSATSLEQLMDLAAATEIDLLKEDLQELDVASEE